jgi:predicted AAA+ superfamily ATPase
VKEWLSILEASYIVYLLKPYHRNYNKRILKSPKLYFIDVGLAAHLLGIEAPDQLATHPLRGELFETFVVVEFLKYRFNAGKSDNLYFFRDRTGNEVDLIVDIGARPVLLEIKSAQTVSPAFFKGLNTFRKLESQTPGAFLIMGTSIRQDRSAGLVRGFSQLLEIFEKLDGF